MPELSVTHEFMLAMTKGSTLAASAAIRLALWDGSRMAETLAAPCSCTTGRPRKARERPNKGKSKNELKPSAILLFSMYIPHTMNLTVT